MEQASDLNEIKKYLDAGIEPPRFEMAGPREKLFFDPAALSCGIVTCGGLCPGLNDVIRSIVMSLHHHCGVRTTFGFETAVSEAKRATCAADAEATGARNGIGLVKLMGRDSGFIAAFSVLVDNQVNFCLIPEVSFTIDGFLSALKQRLEHRGHAVIVVAEGAGQELFEATGELDASGNVKYGDIVILLRDRIKEYFKKMGIEISLKYIDPSYTIRSQAAIPHDSAFCLLLGHNAVHAGMAGRTGMIVGFWNHQFTHVPIPLAVSQRKKIDPEGWIWSSVLASTGQPAVMR